MVDEIKNFVVYSIRYQILLAKHVADKCSSKVYVFDSSGFFDPIGDTELVDGIRTVIKNNKRGVLSVAVKEAFRFNEKLFLQFVDENILEKDDVGLFVNETKEAEEEVKKQVELDDLTTIL